MPDSFIDPRWGLLYSILSEATIGALVVPWGIAWMKNYEHFAPLLGPLIEGVPVGLALRHLTAEALWFKQE